MEYFRIKNWEKYQHRDAIRNGRMPWVKFYTSILIDHKMQQLCPSRFGLWARLVLLVGEIGNKVPLDQRYLRACLAPANFPKRLDLGYMWDLGLIEKWDASLDKDEDKTKTKTKTQNARASDAPPPQKSFKYSPKNKAQSRLENNIRIAEKFMESEHE